MTSFEDIAVGICWYNDRGIFRLLDSLPKQIQKFVVDGKFKFYESKQRISSKYLRDKARKYDNTIVISASDLLEPEKRNVYLRMMCNVKYGLMLDSDEYVKEGADWDLFMSECRKHKQSAILQVQWITAKGAHGNYPRLWVNPSEWEYYKCHNVFRNKTIGRITRSSTLGAPLQGITCSHDDSLREKDYIDSVYEYQKKLIEYEKPLRREFRNTHQIKI